MDRNSTAGYAHLAEEAKVLFLHEAAELGEWLDALWQAHVPHRSAHRHVFTAEELHQRLVLFGVWMGAWMAILGVLSVLAVAKRQYGSIREAVNTWRSVKNRDLVRIVFEGKQYDELGEDSESDEEVRGAAGRPRGCWGRCCCCCPSAADEEDEDRPPFLPRTRLSLRDLERDRQKLEARLKRAQADESDEGEPASDAQRGVDQEIAALKKIGKERLKEKSRGLASASVEREKEILLNIQVEELQASQGGSVPWLQRVKVPVSTLLFAGYVCICAGMPFVAAHEASCTQGLPWEYHMPFFHYFILVKLWEVFLLAFDTSIPGKIGLASFVIKFGCSFLAFFDGYSDSNAILIAHDCGSDLWHWMAVCYAIGVVLLQWVFLGVLSLWLDTSNTCFFKMLHMDALAECSAMKPKEKHALTAWRLVNIFRFLFEDLPQSILQTLFLLTVKKNYIMILSVVVGVCTSAKAIYDASKRAAAALGTNFEYLRAASDMQAAMEREDAKAFFEAYEVAERSGANADSLVERAEAAERTFQFQAAKPVVSLMAGVEAAPPEPLSRAAQAAPPEDSYVRRRRTLAFALREAKRRERERKALEGPSSAAVQAGIHDEGRHSWKLYVGRRRTVDFAVEAQEQREKRLAALVREGAGCCLGSRPKGPNEVADAKCDPALC